ncbi:MAG: nicotinate-nucleotide--dimethylbenzimidazole phosphoribosyltransferase [Candidatus Melainabacteria bacterium]
MKLSQEDIQRQIDNKTKPIGALGRLEELACRVGMIQNTTQPKLLKPTHLVFAGDHGIADEGVSAYPQAVTAQMVMNFLSGGAAASVFTNQHQIRLIVVDAGVNADFEPHPALRDAKIAYGTKNFLHSPAMTVSECEQAISAGRNIVRQIAEQGCNILSLGEMGIGNTASASICTSLFCSAPIEQVTGKGAGLDNNGLLHKISCLKQSVKVHQDSDFDDPMVVLQTFGGFEMVMLAGAFFQAAEEGMVILVDGFIVTAALMACVLIKPDVLDKCIFCHHSQEPGHAILLKQLNANPILDLSLRLGEGTGALLAYPLVESSVLFLNEMATFESAGISEKTELVLS